MSGCSPKRLRLGLRCWARSESILLPPAAKRVYPLFKYIHWSQDVIINLFSSASSRRVPDSHTHTLSLALSQNGLNTSAHQVKHLFKTSSVTPILFVYKQGPQQQQQQPQQQQQLLQQQINKHLKIEEQTQTHTQTHRTHVVWPSWTPNRIAGNAHAGRRTHFPIIKSCSRADRVEISQFGAWHSLLAQWERSVREVEHSRVYISQVCESYLSPC